MFIKAVVLLGTALKGMAGAQVQERTALAQLRPRRESKGRGNNPFLAEPAVLRRRGVYVRPLQSRPSREGSLRSR